MMSLPLRAVCWLSICVGALSAQSFDELLGQAEEYSRGIRQSFREFDDLLVVAIESGRGDYFMAVADAAPFAGTAQTLAATLKDRRPILIGDGAATLAATLRDMGVRAEVGVSSASIDPVVLATHALTRDVEYWARQGLPRPLYLRGADVTLADGERTTADLEG